MLHKSIYQIQGSKIMAKNSSLLVELQISSGAVSYDALLVNPENPTLASFIGLFLELVQ